MDYLKPIHQLNHIPDAILDIGPQQIHDVFPEPTLIQTPGPDSQPLVLSVLLHGNEVTGFFVLQELAKRLPNWRSRRPLWILVGNVDACAAGLRNLPSQPDFNRIWKEPPQEYEPMVGFIKTLVSDTHPFAIVDIHNNTGRNPMYSCITNTDTQNLNLASLFSNTIVYFSNPDSVLIAQTSQNAPSVVLECGPVGNHHATEPVLQYIHDLLHIESLDQHKTSRSTVFHTIGRMKLSGDCRIQFGLESDDASTDICFVKDLQNFNFSYVEKGALVGKISGSLSPLRVYDDFEHDVTDDFFYVDGNKLRVQKNVFPSMLTTDLGIIRNDCLGYLMEPLAIENNKNKIEPTER